MKFTAKVEWIVSALILLGLGLLLLTHDSIAKDEALLQHSNERLRASELLLSLVQKAEAGQRGYLLTGKQEFLKSYKQGLANSLPALSRLRSLLADTPGAQSALVGLDALIAEKFLDLQTTMDLRRPGAPTSEPFLLLSERGEQLTELLVARIAALREAEELRSIQRLRATILVKRTTRIVAFSLVILSWVVFLWSSGRRRKQEKINQTITGQLTHYVQQLEQLHSAEQDNAADLMRLNAQLQSANLLVEQSIQTRTQFVAQISHDIRTPLSGILGISRVLMDSETKVENREYVFAIESCASSLTVLLNDLLDFTKMEAGKIILNPAPFDLSSLCAAVVNLFGVAADDKGISLTLTYAPEAPREVVGDEHRLRQIISNLISNAIKFTQTGNILLSVAYVEASAGHRFRIRVTDTGMGIPPELLQGIFNPYEQADATTSARFGGTGLGLSISKHLVELMGGSIELASVCSQGSVFTVEIPLVLAIATSCKVETDPARETSGVTGAGITVLVVDDNAVNLKVCKRLLETSGASVELASNGNEAVSASATRCYELILMDCNMPGLDGFSAVRLLRQTENGNRSIIVGMTADASVEARRQCFEAGMEECLVKPLGAVLLEELLLKCKTAHALLV